MNSVSSQANTQDDQHLIVMGLLRQPALHRKIDTIPTAEQSLRRTFPEWYSQQTQSGSNATNEIVPPNVFNFSENSDFAKVHPKLKIELSDLESYFRPESYRRLCLALTLNSDGWYWGEGQAIKPDVESTICQLIRGLGTELAKQCLIFASPEGSIELAWPLSGGRRLSVVIPGIESESLIHIYSDEEERGVNRVKDADKIIRESLT